MLAFSAGGCALTFDSRRLGVPVSMAGAASAADTGAAFRVTKHPVYLIAGLLSVSQPNLEDVLAGQVGTAAHPDAEIGDAQPLERSVGDGAHAGIRGAALGDVRGGGGAEVG